VKEIGRRTMLNTLGCVSVGGFFTGLGESPVESKKHEKEIKTIHADIMVAGGGTAGVIAAIQAARAGCSTVLVENGSQLGGTTTTGGVAFPGIFYAWGKQVIGGIGWELVTETVRLNDDVLPDFTVPYGEEHWKHQIRINKYLYALLAEEKCIEAGVQIRFYETPVDIEFKENNWEVETIGKGTHTKIICNQVIDCTGNAALTSLAGFGVLREQETQPGTLMFKIDGYNYESLDLKIIRKRYDEEILKGNLVKEEFRNNIEGLLKSAGDNIQHVAGADSTTSETNTITNINGRSSLLKMLRFLRKLPGCENTRIISMQPETGVRETYRIDGVYQITRDDYVSGKVFDDSVSYSFYPIDLHDENGVEPKQLKKGTVATVPLRALIPKNSRNFMAAGRCVSSDRLANSALRVQASCMAMGQAAGATAALACKNKVTPLEVPIHRIKALIADNGGITP
jgi:glycine/D-amino acid oxidase-like deaminating enzyme